LVFYVLLVNAWKIDFTEEEIKPYITEIKQAEELPNLFYDLYDLDNNNTLDSGTIQFLTKSLFNIKTSRPISFWLARMIYIPKMKERYFINRIKIEMSLAMKIENETSQKEQLNYTLADIDFVNGQIGVKNASKFYFDKEITELNENEVASLIVMTRNPALYNPKRRPEKLKAEVDKLLNK
jgi:membrane carboxypeptidase/penicillin-binding protein PbpC